MKLPAWRQDRAIYPKMFQIQTRYRDQDVLGHVNNISQSAYFDEAREKLMRSLRVGLGDDDITRIVTAQTTVAFLAEVFHPDMVDIAAGISRVGHSSWEIAQAMFQNGRCVALAATTLVQATAEGAQPLSPAFRAALEALTIDEPAG